MKPHSTLTSSKRLSGRYTHHIQLVTDLPDDPTGEDYQVEVPQEVSAEVPQEVEAEVHQEVEAE